MAPPAGFRITDLSTAADPEHEPTIDAPWRAAALGALLAALAAALWTNRVQAALAVLLVLPATGAGALLGAALLGESVTPDAVPGLVLAGGVIAPLAVAQVLRGGGLMRTLAGALLSAAPFLLIGGRETPGHLSAAVAIGGIVLGGVATALTSPLWRSASPDP